MLELILLLCFLAFFLFPLLGGLWNQDVCAELKKLRESINDVSHELSNVSRELSDIAANGQLLELAGSVDDVRESVDSVSRQLSQIAANGAGAAGRNGNRPGNRQ